MGIGNTYEGQPGLRQLAPWLALGVHTRLARCHHKSSCVSTTPRTVFKPQSERKTPWRARCFSGMRWSGCGTALQHPSNRSSVPFVDARQHRDRAWYIEALNVSARTISAYLGGLEVTSKPSPRWIILSIPPSRGSGMFVQKIIL